MFEKVGIITGLMIVFFVSSALPGFAVVSTPASAQQDKATSAVNDVCPVSGEKISKDSNITCVYKGKTYRFCCPDCITEFKKSPEKYIEKMKETDKKKP